MRPEHGLILAIVVGCAAWHEWALRQITFPGFPLDDAWIHLQFARNLARGEFFSLNDADPTAGLTAPLWTLVLAIPLLLPVEPIWTIKSIGVALGVVTAIGAWHLAYEATSLRLAAASAGIAVAASARLTWGSLSGMENPLYAALATLTCWAYLRSRRSNGGSLWGALAGLSGAARPELFVLFPILLGATLMNTQARQANRRSLVRATAWFALAVAAFVAVNLAADGRPLPNTFYAKSGTRGIWNAALALDVPEVARAITIDALTAWNLAFQWLAGHSLLLMTAVLAGALVLTGAVGVSIAPGAAAIVAVLVLWPLAKGAFTPEPPILVQDGRYILHLLVLHLVTASVGFAWLTGQVRAKARPILLLVLALALGRVITTNIRDARTYAAQVKSINDMQVAAGLWIREHTPENAIVATNDIGAISYFGGRTVIDTQGLVTPEIVPFRREGDIVPYLEQVRPYLVAVYPEWHPEIAARPDLFREVHRFTVRPRVIAPADSLIIYATPWQ